MEGNSGDRIEDYRNLDRHTGSFSIWNWDLEHQLNYLQTIYPGLIDLSHTTKDTLKKLYGHGFVNHVKHIIDDEPDKDFIEDPDTVQDTKHRRALTPKEVKNNINKNVEKRRGRLDNFYEKTVQWPPKGYIIVDIQNGNYVGFGKFNGDDHIFKGVIAKGNWQNLVKQETGMSPGKKYSIELPKEWGRNSYAYVPHETIEGILLDHVRNKGSIHQFDISKKASGRIKILAEDLTNKQYDNIIKYIKNELPVQAS